MKKLLMGLIVISQLAFANLNFQKDFGLLEWKSSERLVNIAYEGLTEDELYSDNEDMKVFSHYDYGPDVSRISFYLYKNELYKVEIVYNPLFADMDFLEGKVQSMVLNYGIYSKEVVDEQLGFMHKKGEVLKWAKGPTLISLSGIDLIDETGIVQDSQLIETHEYYPISSKF